MSNQRKHYLVVGAMGAVGRATAQRLRELGHQVTGTARQCELTEDGWVATLNELLILDMADALGVRIVLDPFFARGIDVDGVIVCTGMAPAGPLELAPLDVARQAFEVNTLSVLAIYQSALPALRRTEGALVIVGSISGIMAIPFLGVYSASKFALEGLADVMRREAYRWGVHVAIVEPGAIRTDMTLNQLEAARRQLEALSPAQRELYEGLFKSFTDRVQSRLPSALEPGEVAEVIYGSLTRRDAARQAIGAGAIDAARFARANGDDTIDRQFRDSYGGSLDRDAP